jgi:hypothetical protein
MADQLGIDSIDRDAHSVVLKFRPQAKVDPVRLVSLVRERSDLTLVPPAALRLMLAQATGSGLQAPGSRIQSESSSRSLKPEARSPKGRRPAPSWWTARARTGEVTPGFSKEEILRPAKDDPRAPGGVFAQVDTLLGELLDRIE